MLKILYAAEEEKVEIDEAGNLTITPLDGAAADEDNLLEEEGKDDAWMSDYLLIIIFIMEEDNYYQVSAPKVHFQQKRASLVK